MSFRFGLIGTGGAGHLFAGALAWRPGGGALLPADIYTRAGLPAGALQVIAGGDEAGDRLAHHDDVDGVTFTGSYDVGMYLYRTVAGGRPKPVVCEMGAKNPAVVTAAADLDLAAEGVMRAAFGLSGQK